VAEGATDLIKTKIVALLLAAESIIDRKRSFFEQKLIDEVWAGLHDIEIAEVNVQKGQARTNDVALGSPESASKLTGSDSALLDMLTDKNVTEK
jgi:hypothetical protein